MNDELDSFRDDIKLFTEDADEQLEIMESSLLDIANKDPKDIDKETINKIFRSMHTIKGNAGMFGYNDIVSFTHVAESLLDDVRDDKIILSKELIELLLNVNDHSKVLIRNVIEGRSTDVEQLKNQNNLIKTLSSFMNIEDDESDTSKADEERLVYTKYDINIKLKYDFFRSGMDLLSIIKYLDAIGSIEKLTLIDDDIPQFDKLNPLDAYMKFHIKYETSESKEEIIEAFEFVQEDIDLEVSELIEEVLPLVEIQKPPVEQKNEENIEIKAINTNIKQDSKNTEVNYTLRVDSSKVDILIKQIGEMVIANSKITQKTQKFDDSELEESVEIMSTMLEEIRNSVMNIRMVQVGDSFAKLRRIVNETAKKVNKEIEFEIFGLKTELDKTVIEKISDPIIHMLRNSIDHGIESPEQRIKAGKNKKGTISLNAYTNTGTIVIEISDDGAGINKDIIFQKAVEKNLIDPNINLTDKEIYNLIFLPGFSTATEVSDISGRGVGMDVVKQNIEDLRGDVHIDSKIGQGTKFTINLPLTLAIIDGFLVDVGISKYIIPLNMIQECMELTVQRKESLEKDGYLMFRSKIVPVIDLSIYFKEQNDFNVRKNIVIAKYGDSLIGLIVNELYGEFQTVVKSLGDLFEELKGIIGGTILGSGDIALIIDIPKLIDDKIINSKKGDV